MEAKKNPEYFKKFIPLHDRILVRRQAAKETAGESGRIIRPEVSKEEPSIGTVVAIGPGAPMLQHEGVHAPCVAPGDVILFEKFVGIDFALNEDTAREEKFVIISDAEILGILR